MKEPDRFGHRPLGLPTKLCEILLNHSFNNGIKSHFEDVTAVHGPLHTLNTVKYITGMAERCGGTMFASSDFRSRCYSTSGQTLKIISWILQK